MAPEPALLDPEQVARKAATLIRERGLAKGALVDENDHMCFNGAILTAIAGPKAEALTAFESLQLWNYVFPGDSPGRKKANSVLMELSRRANKFLGFGEYGDYDHQNTSIVHWNNEFARTDEEVARILEQVADSYSTEESSREL